MAGYWDSFLHRSVCKNVGTTTLCGAYARAITRKKLSNKGRRWVRLAHARCHGRHTQAQWQALCCEMSWCCARCASAIDGDPQKDHIVPIYLGGDDAIENLQPLCARCNASKRDDDTNHVLAYREQRVG